ncbi:MAG: periplasmic heavy metal sensor [Asticcacaulis sp.]
MDATQTPVPAKKRPGLKTWLAVSVALNVFLLGSLIGVGLIAQKHLKPSFDRSGPALLHMTEGLSPANQEKARQILTDAALAGEADMEQSRHFRKAASDLMLAPAPDPVAIQAEITKARRAEASAKDKIETAVVSLLLELPPAERTKVAEPLLKTPFRARAKALYDVRKAEEKAREKEKSSASASK